jgi:hypothetical protein
LSTALKLEYEGTKCTASTLMQLPWIAAARVVSVFAACRDLADAPCDQTIRNAWRARLPEMTELERRLKCADLESAALAAGDSRDLPLEVWHQDQLPANERSADSH